MPYHCKSCPKGSRCASCRGRKAQNRKACRQQNTSDPYLIPDDGITDGIAVQIATYGQRKVRLTAGERELAAIAIIADGGSIRDLYDFLSLPSLTSAYALYTLITTEACRAVALLFRLA